MRQPDCPRPGDLLTALALLGRLPLPRLADDVAARGARAAWAWPMAGLLLALLAWLPAALGSALGLAPAIAAGLALAALVSLGGAMHEDGLADVADGFWGGGDHARRLEIMADSRTGAYGVVALILALGLRWLALGALLQADALLAGLIATAMLSRAGMAGLAAALPAARPGGLSARIGRPPARTVALGAGLALAAALLLFGGRGLAAALFVAFALAVFALLCRAKISGQTGDALGAAQQTAEIAALLALAA